jgi:hypothetical protein
VWRWGRRSARCAAHTASLPPFVPPSPHLHHHHHSRPPAWNSVPPCVCGNADPPHISSHRRSRPNPAVRVAFCPAFALPLPCLCPVFALSLLSVCVCRLLSVGEYSAVLSCTVLYAVRCAVPTKSSALSMPPTLVPPPCTPALTRAEPLCGAPKSFALVMLPTLATPPPFTPVLPRTDHAPLVHPCECTLNAGFGSLSGLCARDLPRPTAQSSVRGIAVC